MLVNDRLHKDTQSCRPSGWPYRGEADIPGGKGIDNLMHKGNLSVRGEIGFQGNSDALDTYNSEIGDMLFVSICTK